MKALQWLRGWVPPQNISDEFKHMQRYNEKCNACSACEKQKRSCYHLTPTFFEKIKKIFRTRTIKPIVLITILYILMEFCGMFAMRPYIVQILNTYSVPIQSNLVTLYLGLLGLIANICLVFTVKFLGKRCIYLISMAGNVLCCIGLSEYNEIFLQF